MRLEQVVPPELVAVMDPAGRLLPALLLARRGERRYVQVSRGTGLNHLRWVDGSAVRAAGHGDPPPESDAPPALPWIRARSGR